MHPFMQSIISLGNVVPIEIYRLPTCSSFFIQLLIPHDAKQLLLKNILSPKCISPVPKSLSPGVNLRLYHHSTETETHIYFISKIAKSFDLLGFSRQKADCLNGTFIVPTKFLCLSVSKIHRKTELYVLQESAIWLLLLVNVHLFHKAVKKFFLLQVGELII